GGRRRAAEGVGALHGLPVVRRRRGRRVHGPHQEEEEEGGRPAEEAGDGLVQQRLLDHQHAIPADGGEGRDGATAGIRMDGAGPQQAPSSVRGRGSKQPHHRSQDRGAPFSTIWNCLRRKGGGGR
ncbi:unnamed protein product, partial [Ectocarpus sp. 13 AM-2016]